MDSCVDRSTAISTRVRLFRLFLLIPCWESQRLIPKRSAGPRATKIGVVSLKALDHHRPNREVHEIRQGKSHRCSPLVSHVISSGSRRTATMASRASRDANASRAEEFPDIGLVALGTPILGSRLRPRSGRRSGHWPDHILRCSELGAIVRLWSGNWTTQEMPVKMGR